MSRPTLNSKFTDAELCRRNGWGAGTYLVGDEGYGPTTIEITAVGERCILARTVAPRRASETTWTLRNRDWNRAERHPDLSPDTEEKQQ